MNKFPTQGEPPAASVNILVLVSGNGTNLQALMDAERSGGLKKGRIVAVISDREGAYGAERARRGGIPSFTELPDRRVPKAERRRELSDRILRRARDFGAGLIILAGFLSLLEGEILNAYSGRIINIHPSLLPKFGGLGMYGQRVHQAVLAAGETESGCTVHIVDSGTDTGPILLQRKVPVLAGDTPDTLAERIHREEHAAITEAAGMMINRLMGRNEPPDLSPFLADLLKKSGSNLA